MGDTVDEYPICDHPFIKKDGRCMSCGRHTEHKNQTPQPSDKSVERLAMGIVHYMGDILNASVDQRQGTNDVAIDYVSHLITQFIDPTEAIYATYEFGLDSEGRLTVYYPVYKPVKEAVEATARTFKRFELSSKGKPAFLPGDIIGQYEILERTDVKSHKNRKFRVKCTRCGGVMFRYTNKMRLNHKDCLAELAPHKEDI